MWLRKCMCAPVRVAVCVCACVCVWVGVWVCVGVCTRVCVRARVLNITHVFACVCQWKKPGQASVERL